MLQRLVQELDLQLLGGLGARLEKSHYTIYVGFAYNRTWAY